MIYLWLCLTPLLLGGGVLSVLEVEVPLFVELFGVQIQHIASVEQPSVHEVQPAHSVLDDPFLLHLLYTFAVYCGRYFLLPLHHLAVEEDGVEYRLDADYRLFRDSLLLDFQIVLEIAADQSRALDVDLHVYLLNDLNKI